MKHFQTKPAFTVAPPKPVSMAQLLEDRKRTLEKQIASILRSARETGTSANVTALSAALRGVKAKLAGLRVKPLGAALCLLATLAAGCAAEGQGLSPLLDAQADRGGAIRGPGDSYSDTGAPTALAPEPGPDAGLVDTAPGQDDSRWVGDGWGVCLTVTACLSAMAKSSDPKVVADGAWYQAILDGSNEARNCQQVLDGMRVNDYCPPEGGSDAR